ncbi:TPA: hypothetical protein RI821_002827 [Vibrio cholerae]|uniref:RNase H type-1 domain-containing protein n=1 Tax=Vibrio cholerae TaxID=666 RepID=A0A5B1C298_VIBCL|nr:RNase H family protein [Vibrio cholerae]AKO77405.1 hypothetical protein EN12_19730 [Vibrio cholerae]KAA1255137.1 hypothetical protein F0M16_07925 [Vibrio cholerae]HDV5624267.1 hypothetical protein [Vibrio cholerae]
MKKEHKVPASEVMQNYRDSQKGINHTIEVHRKSIPYATENITIYTDGSAKGNVLSSDQKGFCGWAWMAKRANGEQGMRFGYRDNADNTEAELHAILNAVAAVEVPSRILIITDSQYSMYYLNSMDEILNATGEEQYERTGLTEFGISRELIDEHINVLSKIREILQSNQMIESLKAQWVRSHVLDEYRGKKLYIDVEAEHHRELVNHLIGNSECDHWASKGTDKAIENAINYTLLKNSEGKHHTYDTSIGNPEKIIKKNFSGSFHSRSYAIDYMIKRGIKRFNLDRVDEIIGSGSLDRLNKANEIWKKARSVSTGIDYNPQDMELRNQEAQLLKEYRAVLGLKTKKPILLEGRKTPRMLASVLQWNENVELATKEIAQSNSASEKFSKRFGAFNAVSLSKVNVDVIKQKLENTSENERELGFIR